MAKSGGKMVPDADQVKQILAGIAGQIDEQNSLPPLLSLSVRPFISLEGSALGNWPLSCAVRYTQLLVHTHDTATGQYRARCRSHARALATVTPDDIVAVTNRSLRDSGTFLADAVAPFIVPLDGDFWLHAQGNVKYWRLPEGLPPTDPFNGMYLANYGTHGPELLRLYRESVDGEEHVIAKKLTGVGSCSGRAKTLSSGSGYNRLCHMLCRRCVFDRRHYGNLA